MTIRLLRSVLLGLSTVVSALVLSAPACATIIGVNGIPSLSRSLDSRVHAEGVRWTRVDDQRGTGEVGRAIHEGFHVLQIVGNTPDDEPLGRIDRANYGREVVADVKADPGASLLEAGNEMDKKGAAGDPVTYGYLYMAGLGALRRAGIDTPYLFNVTGDYWDGRAWSKDALGGGWLRDAVDGTPGRPPAPGLVNAILENGVSSHPYGAVGENYADQEGTAALEAQESVARDVLGASPPFYVTEFGFAIHNAARDFRTGADPVNPTCPSVAQASSPMVPDYAAQAANLAAAYEVFLRDPELKGVWWYSARDDTTGCWGLVSNDGAARPALQELGALARAQSVVTFRPTRLLEGLVPHLTETIKRLLSPLSGR